MTEQSQHNASQHNVSQHNESQHSESQHSESQHNEAQPDEVQLGESPITSMLNQLSLVTGEMVEEQGEDAYGYSFNENGGLLATLDGCGGLGAKRYEEYEGKTGAYLASRIVAETIFQWFENFSMNQGRVNEGTIHQIKEELVQEILADLGKIQTSESSGVSQLKKSDLVRELPTTLSLILCDGMEDGLNTAFIWAGDSRGYLLTAEEGLAQITTDDLKGHQDAFENLYGDGRLSNLVSADGQFHLNHRLLSIHPPFIAITATDGCFGYFKTPMEFEYMLLITLLNSESPMEWEQRLEEAMKEAVGDDFSLCFAVFGYPSFEELKEKLYPRCTYLYEKYIGRLADATHEEMEQMWLEYKKDYSRWQD